MSDEADELEERDRDYRPGARTVVLSYPAAAAVKAFLTLVADGIGYYNAGAEVGWSPRIVDAHLAEPEMQEMLADAEQCTLEDIEHAIVRRAKRGNMQAAALYVFNRAPHRWKPPQSRVAVTTVGRVQLEVVEATRLAAIDLITGQDLRSLQVGGPLDTDDAIESTAS